MVLSSTHEINELFDIANSIHQHLKFTYEFSNEQITFLDTCLYKGETFNFNGILDIKTHIKKTETFQYLDRTSAHPKSVFKGFVKGETLRNLRNTNNTSELHKLIKFFRSKLLDRNYKAEEIDPIIQSALQLNRKDLLTNCNNQKDKNLVFITRYNPALKQLKRTLLKHWKLITKDE